MPNLHWFAFVFIFSLEVPVRITNLALSVELIQQEISPKMFDTYFVDTGDYPPLPHSFAVEV